MPRNTDHLLGTADVLAANTEGGEVRLKLGDAVAGTGFADEVPCYGPDGFIGIPNEPSAEGAAQCLYCQDGDGLVAQGCRDNRHASKIGSGQPGDRMIITDGPPRLLIKKATSTATLYSEDSTTGHSMLVAVNGAKGAITLAVGLTKLEITSDKISLSINGGPALTLTGGARQAVEVRGNGVHLDGGLVTLGLIGGVTRPVADPQYPAATSVTHAATGMIPGTCAKNVLVATG